MKAIVQDRYGSADVLELRDIEKPTAGDDDILVRALAAGELPPPATPQRMYRALTRHQLG
jgi:NADPH:quinone reductase-like Zn-dependent oxidoreductase